MTVSRNRTMFRRLGICPAVAGSAFSNCARALPMIPNWRSTADLSSSLSAQSVAVFPCVKVTIAAAASRASRKSFSESGIMAKEGFALARGIFKRGGDVLGFKHRTILEDFFARCARRQKIKHVLDADAQRPDAWPSTALLRIDGDAMRFAH